MIIAKENEREIFLKKYKIITTIYSKHCAKSR